MESGSTAWILPALGFAIAMSISPGPNNAMLASSGASFGLRRTMPHMLGIMAGFPVMVLAIALGAGGVLRTWPWTLEVLRWVGVAYLVVLAWKIAMTRVGPSEAESVSGRPLTFLQGALFQWVNPKAWVTAGTAVVAYTGGGDVVGQAMLLATIFLLVSVPSTLIWTGMGVGASQMLRSPRALRAFNLFVAGLLLASLVPLVREGLPG